MADNDKNMTDMSSDEIIDLDSIIDEDKNLDAEPISEEVTTESVEVDEVNQETEKPAEMNEENVEEESKEAEKTERLPIESIYDSITTVEEKKSKTKKNKKNKKDKQVDLTEEEVENVTESVDPKTERRIQRQKRRRRSRIIAFIVVFIVLAIVGAGAYFGINAVLGTFDKKAEPIVVDVPEPVIEEEPVIVDMTPDIEEEVEPEEEDIVEEEIVQQSDEELLDEMVRTMIAEMTLEEKVSGLFIVSPEILTGQGGVTKAGEGTKTALDKYPVGGMIYSKQNVKTADQLKELIENTISYNRFPMFIGITEESGADSKLAALKVESTASAKELGAGDNSSAVFDAYNTIGKYLSENGFNLDFAPVADAMSSERSFGEDPVNVANMVTNAIGGLKEAGVYTCVKNFPGMGHVSGDPATSLVSTERTKAEIEESELVPFKAAIEAGTDMIMVGHFSVPAIEEDNLPSSLSKAVMTELLRNEMGYEGVIITDAMNVASISQYYGADEVAIKAFKAGADMVLLPENLSLAVDGVVEAVNEGTIDERRIDDSLARVYKIKYKNTLAN